MSDTSETKGGWKQRARHELVEYWMTFLYLALYFGTFTIYRRLVLAQYDIIYLNYGVAFIEALVLAKVILVGDLLRLGKRFENRPLFRPTIIRAALFTLWVALFKVVESSLRGTLRGEGPVAGVQELLAKGKHELLASSLVVFFTFIPFFAFRELNRALGRGTIWRLFFRPQSPTEPRTSI